MKPSLKRFTTYLSPSVVTQTERHTNQNVFLLNFQLDVYNFIASLLGGHFPSRCTLLPLPHKTWPNHSAI